MTKPNDKDDRERPSREDRVRAALDGIEPFIREFAQGSPGETGLFSLCVRASLVKSFEYCKVVWSDKHDETMFFFLPALRGICEELVFLNFAQRLPDADRAELFGNLMAREVNSQVASQAKFFTKWREFQPVLASYLDAKQAEDADERIRSVWRKHGWPKLEKKVIPQVRELADKGGEHVLDVLYGFLYDLTSGTVHFRVQSLLRTGWGEKPHAHFSTENFSGYSKLVAAIYGAFLFCLYFELLEKEVAPHATVLEHVSTIRKYVLEYPRWPEMVTYEEMNVRPKRMLSVFEEAFAAMYAEGRTRLIPLPGEELPRPFETGEAPSGPSPTRS